MGREVRRIKRGWVHPVNDDGKPMPLFGRSYAKAVADWDAECAKWCEGQRPDYCDDETLRSDVYGYYLWAGQRPQPHDYMPDFGDEADMLVMYESTSEGTPISPAFETPEELAKWLADNDASSFGRMTATYEQWLNVCRGAFAPSMVIKGDRIMSGPEATAPAPDPKT